jgi:hypothetical protein
VLAFYSNGIGLDAETFSSNGGAASFETAQMVQIFAQSGFKAGINLMEETKSLFF